MLATRLGRWAEPVILRPQGLLGANVWQLSRPSAVTRYYCGLCIIS